MGSIRLADIINHYLVEFSGYNDSIIAGITMDSRKVQPGFVFVAVKGATTDGHRFIQDAIQKGAVAVFGTEYYLQCPVPYFRVENSRAEFANLCSMFFGYPARNLTVIGVTGTDGKTTTCSLVYEILKTAGIKAGMISTVSAVIDDEMIDTGFHVTTPEADDIQKFLRHMVDKGITHVVLETTSHALEQKRVQGCEYDFGVLTNITHEHLDFHGSYESYRNAKALLFESLMHSVEKPVEYQKGAVLNQDDPSFIYLSQLTKVKTVTYGFSPEANFQPENISHEETGMSLQVSTHFIDRQNLQIPVTTSLSGEYNVMNILAASGLAIGLMNMKPSDMARGIKNLKGIPGRMEKIDLGQDFLCYVDFAHTPNALLNTIKTATKILSNSDRGGRVITVFGSAGLRDKQKRFLMADISAQWADITILTAEDPRIESLEAILIEMEDAMNVNGVKSGSGYFVIPDRGEAIQYAIDIARAGDIVLICGKGHEQSMCFGEIEYLWDDRIAATSAISQKLRIPGPAMPYLPTSKRLS